MRSQKWLDQGLRSQEKFRLPPASQTSTSASGLRACEIFPKPFKSRILVSYSLLAPLFFKARCFGSLSSWCRAPRLENPRWSSDPLLLSNSEVVIFLLLGGLPTWGVGPDYTLSLPLLPISLWFLLYILFLFVVNLLMLIFMSFSKIVTLLVIVILVWEEVRLGSFYCTILVTSPYTITFEDMSYTWCECSIDLNTSQGSSAFQFSSFLKLFHLIMNIG